MSSAVETTSTKVSIKKDVVVCINTQFLVYRDFSVGITCKAKDSNFRADSGPYRSRTSSVTLR